MALPHVAAASSCVISRSSEIQPQSSCARTYLSTQHLQRWRCLPVGHYVPKPVGPPLPLSVLQSSDTRGLHRRCCVHYKYRSSDSECDKEQIAGGLSRTLVEDQEFRRARDSTQREEHAPMS